MQYVRKHPIQSVIQPRLRLFQKIEKSRRSIEAILSRCATLNSSFMTRRFSGHGASFLRTKYVDFHGASPFYINVVAVVLRRYNDEIGITKKTCLRPRTNRARLSVGTATLTRHDCLIQPVTEPEIPHRTAQFIAESLPRRAPRNGGSLGNRSSYDSVDP